jgi:hypothetical protein
VIGEDFTLLARFGGLLVVRLPNGQIEFLIGEDE